ncbi:hypothetical protein ABIB25_001469 [Nakamurella sp. UYEF19]
MASDSESLLSRAFRAGPAMDRRTTGPALRRRIGVGPTGSLTRPWSGMAKAKVWSAPASAVRTSPCQATDGVDGDDDAPGGAGTAPAGPGSDVAVAAGPAVGGASRRTTAPGSTQSDGAATAAGRCAGGAGTPGSAVAADAVAPGEVAAGAVTPGEVKPGEVAPGEMTADDTEGGGLSNSVRRRTSAPDDVEPAVPLTTDRTAEGADGPAEGIEGVLATDPVSSDELRESSAGGRAVADPAPAALIGVGAPAARRRSDAFSGPGSRPSARGSTAAGERRTALINPPPTRGPSRSGPVDAPRSAPTTGAIRSPTPPGCIDCADARPETVPPGSADGAPLRAEKLVEPGPSASAECTRSGDV